MEYPEVTFPGLRDKRGIIEKTDMTTKISFLLPSDKTGEATAGMILGDFNNWNPEEGIYLRKQDDGSMVADPEQHGLAQPKFIIGHGRGHNPAEQRHRHQDTQGTGEGG